MQLSIEEVKKLDSNSYQIIDIRSEEEVAHGAIKGALNIQAEEIELDERVPHDKKLVIVCSRGKTSVDVAEYLTEKGFDAASLKGGYISWLLDAMKEDEVAERDIKADVEQSIRKKFKKSIWRKFTKAINTYELVKPGDKIAVCISGGKDSMLMAKLFQELKHHNKFDFDVKFLVMDPGYNEANRHVIEENCRNLGIPATIFESDIFDAVYDIEKSPCYLCARMRRGHLYAFAKELGCNKIALGHHYDDVIETILMGMLYGAQVQTMMPKLHSTNFEGMELIRPLYLVREDDIKAWRDYNGLHFIQCACKFTDTCTTCNNEENRSKRVEIKQLIANLKKVNPFVEANIFKSVENVNLATDGLIFSQLIYVQMKPYMPDAKKSYLTIKQLSSLYCADHSDDEIEQMPNLFRHSARLLQKLAHSRRYADCILRYYIYDISEKEESQFSAVTIELPDGTYFISYSGTDHSIVGWKENFNLSYLDETPGQNKAKKYLKQVAAYICNDDRVINEKAVNDKALDDENINNKSINTRKLWIGGHSKGGNLAVFAAMHVDKEVQDVIIKVFNFDGPGFNHKMIYTAGYKRIFDRIETFLPQSSIVGLLLEHVDNYEVVRSHNSGPLQHDAFSWEIMGGSIIKADGLDKNSVRLDKTLRNWIGSMDEAQRKQFVNVLFSIASDSNFENLDQMSFKQLIEMIKAADDLSKADWSMLKDTVRLLISAGVGVVRDEKEK